VEHQDVVRPAGAGRAVRAGQRQQQELAAPLDGADPLAGRLLETGVLGSRRGVDPLGAEDGAAGQPGRQLAPDRLDLRKLGDT
jgi:hypothetical protein